MSAREWNSTPWWEQQVLIEGLEAEDILTISDEAPGGGSNAAGGLKAERVHKDGMTTITERDFEYDLSEMDDISGLGFGSGWLG